MTDEAVKTLEKLVKHWEARLSTSYGPEKKYVDWVRKIEAIRSVLKRLEAAERARDTQSGVVARLLIRERQLEEEIERLRAEIQTHLSDKEKLRGAWKVLEAKNERLRAALERMANDGCGCVTLSRSACLTEYPKDQEQWCWSCMAVNALQGEEGK